MSFTRRTRFRAGVSLEGGQGSTVIVGSDTMFDGGGSILSGPLGTGTLSVSQWTNSNWGRIEAALGARSVGNPVSLIQNLQIQGTNDMTLSGLVTSTSSSGGIWKVGAGTLTMTGANTYTGTTTINQGTVAVGSSSLTGPARGPLGTGQLTIAGGAIQASGAARSIANTRS